MLEYGLVHIVLPRSASQLLSGAQQAGEEPGEPLQRGLQRAHGAHWSMRHLVKSSGEVRMLPCHP
jgi:hypothetical protein